MNLEKSMWESLKCPKCCGDLEKGYLQAPKGLYWDKQKHSWTTFLSEEIVSYLAVTIPNEQAYRCPKCKLILFTY